MPMSAGYIPFHPEPVEAAFKPPPGAVDAHCHVFGPEAKFPYAPERKYTPCDAPEGKAVRAARFSRLRQERDRAGELPRQGQPRAGRCARRRRTTRPAASPSSARKSPTPSLKAMDRAGVRGVRFNFLTRLVDFTPRDVLVRDRRAGRAARLAHRGLFRGAGPARARGRSSTRCRPRSWSITWAARREEGRRSSRVPALPAARWPSTRTSGSR